jgi:hypothetical protein
MKFDVYIQDKYVGVVEATNTGTALSAISQKISSGEFSFDEALPKNIKIEPKNEENEFT